MSLIAESHDVFVLVVFPVKESLHCLLVFPGRIISHVYELSDIIHLEADAILVRLQSSFSCAPLVPVFLLIFFGRKVDLSKDVVTTVPCLGIKHIESKPLVLHADVHQARVFPKDALVAIFDPEAVLGS